MRYLVDKDTVHMMLMGAKVATGDDDAYEAAMEILDTAMVWKFNDDELEAHEAD